MTRAPRAGAQTSERAHGFQGAPGSLRIVLDFDGTITERDTLELVVEEFGDPSVRREVEAGLDAGLSLQEVIARQYATVQAPLLDVVAWAVENVRFRPGFHELVRLAQEQGWEAAIVSSGVRELIEPLLAREGIEGIPVAANSVDPDPSGWQVLFRDQEPCRVCGQPCKRRSIAGLAGEGPLVYVGDGYSDGCAAGAADYVFARRRLVTYLEERGQRFEPFDDFVQVARRLSELTGLHDAPERDIARALARAEARAARLEVEAQAWRKRAQRAEASLSAWRGWETRTSWRVFQRLMRLRAELAPAGSRRDRIVRAAVGAVAGGSQARSRRGGTRPATDAVKAVLFVSGRPGATKRYRCDHRAEELAYAGASVDVAMIDEVDLEDAVGRYRFIVLHRVPFDQSLARFVERARERGRKVIFDTDDLLFDRSAQDSLPPSAVYDGVEPLARMLAKCDAVTVTTQPLAEAAAALNEHVRIEPNVVSDLMVEQADAALRRRAVEEPADTVTIAYLSGTATHDEDFLEAADAVLWALDTYPFVRFRAVGRLGLDSRFDRFDDRVEQLGMQPWEILPDILSGIDINLAPLEKGNRFSDCKSCLKYLEAALLAVPTIASPRPDFVRAIRPGENGLLADSPNEWQAALRKLAESPEHRRKLGQAAHEDVRASHVPRARAAEARETLRGLVSMSPTAPLAVNWLGTGTDAHPLAGAVAEAGWIVRIFGAAAAASALPAADVSIATDRTTAEIVLRHEKSLFRCYVASDPADDAWCDLPLLPILATGFTADGPGRFVEVLGLPANADLEGEHRLKAGRKLQEILQDACLVQL